MWLLTDYDAAGLCELAGRARDGEPAARNALWDAMREVVARAVERQRALPRLWDRDDLRQEAFVVFAGVCSSWDGSDVRAYFQGEYPRALARRVRREWRRQRRERSWQAMVEAGEDVRATQMYRVAEIVEAISRLPEPVRTVLRLHVVWGLPLAQIGRQLGLGRRGLERAVPLARRAISGELQTREQRLEGRVRALFASADSRGYLRGTSRQIRRRLGMSPQQYDGFLEYLERSGVLAGRARGHAGRLTPGSPDAALRLLRERARGAELASGRQVENTDREGG